MERLEYFRLFSDISVKHYELLIQMLQTKAFKKNHLLLHPGQVQRELYLVKSGIQMSYFEAEEKSHVIAFTYPPNFCAVPESFSFQKPSTCSLTCLTDTELDCISYQELQKLFNASQEIERLFRRMMEAVLAGMINRHIELHSLSIKQRFTSFCQRSPQLLHQVPHKYIASYLGIDQTNFSKLFNNVKF